MDNVSHSWPETEWTHFLEKFPEFDGIGVQHIPTIASSLRDGVRCALEPKFDNGSCHVVFKVLFADGAAWACRVRHRNPHESPEFQKLTLEATVATMRYVRSHTNLPVPEVHDYQSVAAATPLNSTYMFMDFVPGRKRDQYKEEITDIQLEKIYDQMADLT